MKLFCLVLGLLVAPCAAAESLVPTAEVGFSFGGVGGNGTNAFLELRASEFIGPERLDVIKARVTSRSGPVASLLGVPLGKHHLLFEAEEEAASKTNWLWWGLGAAAVAGVVVLSNDDDNDSGTQQAEGCTFVGGTTAVPPSDDFGVDPSCL